ncbi:DnaJ subfamily C member 25 [Bonamia ostreae]|uniref:DnaJ subfamily C member 25 n=1 Tax=Bonamia ostreae TaxID=126728 RepID=A0ABV2AMF0_9EUKA
MPRKGIFALVLFFLLKQTCSFPSREDFMNNWCGDENCYDLLEVKNSADKEDIVKKYKQLAIK